MLYFHVIDRTSVMMFIFTRSTQSARSASQGYLNTSNFMIGHNVRGHKKLEFPLKMNTFEDVCGMWMSPNASIRRQCMQDTFRQSILDVMLVHNY